ncbi:YibE/F family protein [Enterococcus saccharolyticus]|uniref:YibE/F family protein n=1 Tax=Enterococcus saccharolyticus TaxID=41997 RepID=UPI0039DF6A11
MKQKIILGIVATILCVFSSLLIQTYSGQWYHQPLAKIQSVEIKDSQQQITAIGINGEKKGQQMQLVAPYQENEIESVHLVKGNQVFYQGKDVVEKKRDGFVFFMVSFLLLTLLFVGGKTGITTFISAVLNSGALFFTIWFYREHTSLSLLPITMIYMVFSVAITLFLIDGIQKNSLQKFLATLVTILTAFGICYMTMALLHDKGLRFEDMGVLTRPYRPIYLASLLVGAIGASLDTVVTVIATLEEIETRNQHVTLKQLIQSGKTVGNDISGTMINVLICSYFSSAIPVILLYLFNGWTFSQTINMLLSLEAVRVLCGGFGILLSIPISLFFFSLGRRKLT